MTLSTEKKRLKKKDLDRAIDQEKKTSFKIFWKIPTSRKKIVGAVQCKVLKRTAKTKTSNLGGEHPLQIIAKTGYPPNSRLRPDIRFSTKERRNQRIGEVAKQYENN